MSTNHPLSNEPPMTGSVVGCSMDPPSASDVGSSGQAEGHVVVPAERTCRYQWVGDSMRERLDAMEKERTCSHVFVRGDGEGGTVCARCNVDLDEEHPNCPQLNILDP